MKSSRAELAQWLRLADAGGSTLSVRDLMRAAALVTVRHVERGASVLTPGDAAPVQGVVTRGCLRVFFSEPDGSERVLYFAPEGWWVADLESVLLHRPTSLAIDALERSELVLMDPASLAHLHAEAPGCGRLIARLAERTLARLQRRLVGSLRKSAEERYLEFRALYPDLEPRIPQYHIAEYVGISAEFLSKLRKRLFAPDAGDARTRGGPR